MKIVALILIVVGLIGVAYGGITWTRQKKVVDLGPVQVTQEERNRVPVPPIAGGICLVLGTVLLLRGRPAH